MSPATLQTSEILMESSEKGMGAVLQEAPPPACTGSQAGESPQLLGKEQIRPGPVGGRGQLLTIASCILRSSPTLKAIPGLCQERCAWGYGQEPLSGFVGLKKILSEIMRSPESSQSRDGPQKARAGGLLHPDCAHHAAALQSVPLLPGLMLPIWSAQMHEAPQFLLLEQYNHYCSRYPKSYKHSFKRNGGIIFSFI